MERQGAIAEIEGQISWVYCNDLDASCAFYANGLGLQLWRDAGSARIFRTAPSAFIGVCRVFGDRSVNPAGAMITLLSEDVDGCYERLLSCGIVIRQPPREIPEFGIYSFFCEDPEGYVVEVQRFLDKPDK